jgi:hypothetical protein
MKLLNRSLTSLHDPRAKQAKVMTVTGLAGRGVAPSEASWRPRARRCRRDRLDLRPQLVRARQGNVLITGE